MKSITLALLLAIPALVAVAGVAATDTIVRDPAATVLPLDIPPSVSRLRAQDPDMLPDKAVSRLGTSRLSQHSGIAGIAISADGRWMATGTHSANQVYLWDLRSGTVHWVFHGHAYPITHLQFSPDGQYLLYTNGDDGVDPETVVWKVKTGELVKQHRCRSSLSQDGKNLAIGFRNRVPDPALRPHPPGDPPLIYKGFTVNLVDFPSYKVRCSFSHPDKFIASVALSPDGSLIAAATIGEILLWDTATGKALPSIAGLKQNVSQLKFSPDGKMLTATEDAYGARGHPSRTVGLWEARTGKKLDLPTDKARPFDRIELLPNGAVMTVRTNGTCELWAAGADKPSRTFQASVMTVFDNGKSLALNRGSRDNHDPRVFFEELATGKPLPLKGSSGPLIPWKFSDDGKTLLTRTEEKVAEPQLLQAWDMASGKEFAGRRTTKKIPLSFTHVPVTQERPNIDLGKGKELQYQWSERTLRIVDTRTSRQLLHLPGISNWCLSADRRLLTHGTSHGHQIIDLTTLKEIAVIGDYRVAQAAPHQLVFTPDGPALATSDGQVMRLYDVKTGKERWQFPDVGSFVLSPDGRRLAMANLVGTVDVFDTSLQDPKEKKVATLQAADRYPALMKSLKDKVPSQRLGAVVELGTYGYLDAVPALAEMAHKDPDSGVRRSAIHALLNIGTDDGVAALIPLLKDKDRDVRHVAMFSLASFGPRGTAAVPMLIDIAVEGPDFEGRKQAVEALANIGTDPCITIIIGLLTDKNDLVRQVATNSLFHLGARAKAAIPVLVKIIGEETDDVKRMPLITVTLGRLGDDSIPALIDLLKDKSSNTRTAAVRALGQFGPRAKAAVPALIACLKDHDQVRSSAITTLQYIGPDAKAAVPALEELTKSPDRHTRESAESALFYINIDLIHGLKSKNQTLRSIAARLFASLGAKAGKFVPELLEIAKEDTDRDIRDAAIEALASIGIHAEHAIPVLAEIARNDTDLHVRQHAVLCLGRIGSDKCIPVLIDLLKDDFELTRLTAGGMLVQFGPRAKPAVPTLLAWLKSPRHEVRESASSLLVKILPETKDSIPILEELTKNELPGLRLLARQALERARK